MMTKRDYSLDVLKIFATIFIVLHHYQQLVYPSGSGFFYGGHFYWGRMVELFFEISGFLMLRYQKKIQDGLSFKTFYVRRALRLLPLTAIAAVVYEILIVFFKWRTGTLFMGTALYLGGMLLDAFGIQAGWSVPNPMVNNPTWYISVLMLCYLVFYGLNKLSVQKKRNVCYLYLIPIALGAGVISYNISLPFLNLDAARGYCGFFTGIILANLLGKKDINRKLLYFLSIAGIFVTLGAFIYYNQPGVTYDDYYWFILVTFPSVIVLFESSLLKRILSWNKIGVIAQCSFDVFIWHVCVDVVVKYLMIRFPRIAAITDWKLMLVVLIIDYMIGAVSYVVIEKNLMKRIGGIYAGN